jgi:hypothetical protein
MKLRRNFCNERTWSTALDAKLVLWGISNHFVTARSRCKTGRTGVINAQVRSIKLRQNFSQRTHILGRFEPFRYYTKVDAKLAEQAPLTHKFTKWSCVGIFRYERTWSTPLDPKLMFWGIQDRFFTSLKSMQNCSNGCYQRTSSLYEVTSENFATNASDLLYWTQNSCFQAFRNVSLLHESRWKTGRTGAVNAQIR